MKKVAIEREASRALKCFSILLLACTLFLPEICRAEIQSFTGNGDSKMSGVIPKSARKKAFDIALNDALKKAVVFIIQEEVPYKKRASLKKKVLSKRDDFIIGYQVKSEKGDGEVYSVVLNARIDMGVLKSALRKGGFLKARKGLTVMSILIDVSEESSGDSAWFSKDAETDSEGEKMSAEILRDMGFKALKPKPVIDLALKDDIIGLKGDKILEKARELKAKYLVFGTYSVSLRQGLTRASFKFARAQARIKIMDVASGEILSVQDIVKNLEAPPSRARREALRAALQIALDHAIAEAWPKLNLAASNRPSIHMKVIFDGLNSYKEFARVNEVLEREIPTLKNVKLIELSPAKAVFSVQYPGPPSKLAKAISRKRYDGFFLERDEKAEGMGEVRMRIKY